MNYSFIEYKYSILGNMSHLVESLSAIEKEGLLSKVGGPGWVYENDQWRFLISPSRLDIFPKRVLNSDFEDGELETAFSLLANYYADEPMRIAINAMALYRPDDSGGNLLYRIAGLDIERDTPSEFSLRFNKPVREQGNEYVLNNIITVAKGSVNYLGNLEPSVYVQFDINVAPPIKRSFVAQNIAVLSGQLITLFKEDAHEYLC